MRKAVIPSPALLQFLRARSGSFCCCPEKFPSSQSFESTITRTSQQRHSSTYINSKRALSSLKNSQRPHRSSRSATSDLPLISKRARQVISWRRSFTTSGTTAGVWNLFGKKKKGPNVKVGIEEHSPLSSFLDESAGLGRIAKPVNELKLRCTEFDENGKVTLVNGEFKKSELIAKYGLLPRDLRKIDSSLLPHILVRQSAILVNLLHLRVLIQHNRVLVFDVYGSTDSYNQSIFMYDLEGRLRQKDTRQAGALPYEFRALEAILISVTSGLEGEFEGVREPVVRVLRELEEDIDRYKLRYLLIYSKKLGTFEQKARLVRNAIDDLLEADDDLASMYLTEKAAGKTRSENDHTEVEMLLESYHKVTDEIVQASENLVSNIRNTEEIVKAILDANRNALMLLDLKFSIGTLGLGAGTFIAALYGMNLTNFLEESSIGFGAVSAACTALTLAVCVYAMKRLRRVQRIKMWGEAGHSHQLAYQGYHGNGNGGNGAAYGGNGQYASATAGTGQLRALETPVSASLVGKHGGVAAAIAEKKAERVKHAKKAAAAAAVAAAEASRRAAAAKASAKLAAEDVQPRTTRVSSSSPSSSSISSSSSSSGRKPSPAPSFGPRYGDPTSRFATGEKGGGAASTTGTSTSGAGRGIDGQGRKKDT